MPNQGVRNTGKSKAVEQPHLSGSQLLRGRKGGRTEWHCRDHANKPFRQILGKIMLMRQRDRAFPICSQLPFSFHDSAIRVRTLFWPSARARPAAWAQCRLRCEAFCRLDNPGFLARGASARDACSHRLEFARGGRLIDALHALWQPRIRPRR